MKYIFASPKMKAIQARIRQVAGMDSTVLITGESGSGKEVVARSIHEQSERRKNPFVAVNCASFPGSLMEVELFGYEKGAFTGANQRHKGLFEQAHGGTLLLDEIAELDLGLQAKFLRVIQEKQFRRVGGESEISVDVRLLASTHRDLKKLVDAGKFREDLFYRISVFPIDVAPLRERPEDVTALTAQYIDHFNREMGKRVEGIAEDTKNILLSYTWPGNVRELRNTIERVMILRDEAFINPEELPIEIITGVQRLPPAKESQAPNVTGISDIQPPASSPHPADAAAGPIEKITPPPEANDPSALREPTTTENHRHLLTDPKELEDIDGQIARFEKDRIAAALRMSGKNQSEAARLLGIRRDTLRFRMKKHKLL